MSQGTPDESQETGRVENGVEGNRFDKTSRRLEDVCAVMDPPVVQHNGLMK